MEPKSWHGRVVGENSQCLFASETLTNLFVEMLRTSPAGRLIQIVRLPYALDFVVILLISSYGLAI